MPLYSGINPGYYSSSYNPYNPYSTSSYGRTYSSSTTSSKSVQRTPRCTDDYITDGNIDINKIGQDKIPISSKTIKRFEKLKKRKERTQTAKTKLSYISTSNTKQADKRAKLEKKYKEYEEAQKKLAGVAYHRLSEYLKKKTLQRMQKMQRNPKEIRIDKFACSLKALFQTLSSKDCKNSSTSSSSSTTRLTNMESLANEYEKKIISEYADYEELAKSYIRFIIQKREKAPEVLKQINMIDEKFASVLTNMIETLTTCNE